MENNEKSFQGFGESKLRYVETPELELRKKVIEALEPSAIRLSAIAGCVKDAKTIDEALPFFDYLLDAMVYPVSISGSIGRDATINTDAYANAVKQIYKIRSSKEQNFIFQLLALTIVGRIITLAHDRVDMEFDEYVRLVNFGNSTGLYRTNLN